MPGDGVPGPICRATAWYRLFVGLYPSGFRAAYGKLLVQAFRDRARDAFNAGGSLALAGFWLVVFSDLARTVPTEHAAAFGHDVEIAFTAIASGARRAIASIVMLAVPMAAAIVLFGIVDVVWLAPIPFSSPSSLVRIGETGSNDVGDPRLSYRTYAALARDHRRLAAVGTMAPVPSIVDRTTTSVDNGTATDDSDLTYGLRVSPSVFGILGMRPALGRLFDRSEPDKVAVISDRLWHSRFRGSPSALGATLRIGRTPLRIIGVLSPHATFVDPLIDVFFPLDVDAAIVGSRSAQIFPVLARLQPGVSLASVKRRLAQRGFIAQPYGLTVSPLTRIVLYLSLALVALSMCGACVTVVARGLLTRADAVLARRAAFLHGGAISLCSGLLALATAAPIIRSLNTITADTIPHLRDFVIDAPLVGFATLIIMLTGIAVSVRIAPERRFVSQRIVRLMTTVGVWGQLGIASLLTIVATLSIGHVRAVASERLGFDPNHLYVATLYLPGRQYASDASVLRLAPRLARDLETDVIVDGATVATGVPFSGVQMETNVGLAGRQAALGSAPLYELESVLPNYFAVMDIPLVAGRTFQKPELGGTQAVIVNQAFAQRFFGRGPAVGRSLRLDSVVRASRIVGVVGDVIRGRAEAVPSPAIYLPRAQLPAPFVTVVVRADANDATMASLIRRHVTRLNSMLNVTDARPLSRNISKSMTPLRFEMWLLVSSAAFALLLACSLLTDGVFAVQRAFMLVPGVAGAAAIAIGLRSYMLSWLPVPQGRAELTIAIVSVSLLTVFYLCVHAGARRPETHAAQSREALHG